MSAPVQGGNGQYYNWDNNGPDMSKYAAPSKANEPPPYGFSNLPTTQPQQPMEGSYPPQPASYPPQQASYPPQQASYPPQQASYPPQQGSYPPQQGTYPPPQGVYPPQSVVGMPAMPAASARTRGIIKRVLYVRIAIFVIALVVMIVAAVTGYYSY